MQFIYNKDSADNAVIVEDYPWGYKLKTKRKYWIETTKKGDRFCYQTLNPKTNKWCAVKKSTYSAVKVMYFDENDHVKTYSINLGYSDAQAVYKFEKSIDVALLTKEQRMKICEAKAVNEVASKTKWTITSNPQRSEEEQAKHDAEQEAVKDKLNKYGNYVYGKCLQKNGLA